MSKIFDTMSGGGRYATEIYTKLNAKFIRLEMFVMIRSYHKKKVGKTQKKNYRR